MGKQITIPIFEAIVDDDGLGLFGISYVDQPAIMEELVAFKDSENMICLSSREKHEIVSPLAIPNQLIYRVTSDGIPYYMRMSEETIRTMAQKYLASGNWNQWTFMHENMDADMDERVQDGIYMKRMWIIDDPKNDDACTKYGFNLPKGTLMVHAKVLNRSIWSKIKSGEIRGLSLEAFFKLKNINKALEVSYKKMSKFDFNEKTMNLFNRFIAFLNEVSVEAEGIADEAKKDETESGQVELKYFLDDEHYLTVDGEGIVRDENLNPVEDGEYRLADSNILVVDNGHFVETKTVKEEENKVEAPVAETFEQKEDEDEKDDAEAVDEPEGKDEETEGEADGDASDADGEGAPVDDEKVDGDGAEEDKKDDEKLEEEAPMINAVPYEINGVEYLLPTEVIDYIESLKTSKVEVEEKLTKMSEQTPSAQPIGTVVKNVDNNDSINDRVSMLSNFSGFRHRL